VHPELESLRTADPDEVATRLAEIDPELLVLAVRETSDDDLLAVLAREGVRPVVVRSLLSRLHEYAVPEALAVIDGTVSFVLDRRGRVLEEHTIGLHGGTLEVLEFGPSDVTLRTSLLRFVRIISGERNAGLEYLSGKLDIDGDADLALAVGGLFRVPGSDTVAVDPRTLDPVEVATALGEVKGDHLKKVMRSGFRTVVLEEIFRRLPDFVDQQRAAKSDLVVGFRLTGNPSGEIERYVVEITGGAATVTTGDSGSATDRDATVTCEGHDFLRLATGHLNPVLGVLRGQLKVKGDQAKALQLSSVIDIPKPR
jgi:putative sterol carrier protein